MAFDGNGNWVSNYSAVAQRDADLPILASNFDNILLADLATSFENCLTKDMQVKPQQAFDANSYKVINVADPTNPNDAVNKETLESSINTLLSSLYPVGSLYIGTQNTCPLETLITGSTWTLVATDKALWGGDGTNANTTINAGLPDISGSLGSSSRNYYPVSGAFYSAVSTGGGAYSPGSGGSNILYSFKASSSNPIYGGSTTVQPPAYRVNVWRRTA